LGIAALLGKGDGTFQNVASPALPPAASSVNTNARVLVGDFNGDGLTDLLLPGAFSSGISHAVAYFGQGKTLTGPVYFPFGQTDVIGAADFNGDGKTDLVTSLAQGLASTSPPSSSAATLPSGYVGGFYKTFASPFLEGTDGNAAVLNGALPPGLEITRYGIIVGTPTSPGTFAFTVSFSERGCPEQRHASLSILPTYPTPVIAAVQPDCLTSGDAFEVEGTGFTPGSLVLADGVPLPTTFLSTTKLSALLKELSGDLSSIVITVAPGSNAFPVAIDNGLLGPSVLPDATRGVPYQEILHVAVPNGTGFDGKTGYAFVPIFGNVPGLSLDSAGRLSGTPSEVGTFLLEAAAQKGACRIVGTLSLTVNELPVPELCPVRWSAPARLPVLDESDISIPEATAIADFNGDGLPDIASFPLFGNCVSIFLGLPGGRMAPSYCVYPAVPTTGFLLFQAIDVDRDGILDLVSGSFFYPGVGDGTFREGIPLEGRVFGFGEFNRDGQGDYASYQNGSVDVYFGTGGGAFRHLSLPPVIAGQPSNAVVGDFNGDGTSDLAVAYVSGGFSPPYLVVYLSREDGTFKALDPSPLQSGDSIALAADVNGDGKLDLVVSSAYGGVGAFPGKGNGQFGSRIQLVNSGRDFAMGDLNGDGKIDIVYGDDLGTRVALSRGDGTFTTLPNLYQPGSVQIADLDRDGKGDVVLVGTRRNEVLVLYGNGDGTLRGPTIVNSLAGIRLRAFAGDFNEDGKLDLYSPPATILLGDGQGGFAATTPPIPPLDYVDDALVADFDGDGHLDIAILSGTDVTTLQLLYGRGNGTFEAAAPLVPTPLFAGVLALGDFDGNGRPDIAVSGFPGTTLQTFLNHGNRSFTPSGLTGATATIPTAGDFDEDGKTDLIGTPSDASDGRLWFLRSQGDGTFRAEFPILPTSSPSLMRVADFDGDGHLDIFLADNSAYTLLHGNGDGTFTSSALATIADERDEYRVSALGDFNGDGAPDLVLGDDSANGQIAVLTNRGDGTFDLTATFAAANGPYGLAVGDFTGSGGDSIAALDQAVWMFRNETRTLRIHPDALPAGRLGSSYFAKLSVGGSGSPASFRLASGQLAPGLVLNSSSGLISGTPTSAGSFFFTVTADETGACAGSRRYSLEIAPALKRPGVVPTPTPEPVPVDRR